MPPSKLNPHDDGIFARCPALKDQRASISLVCLFLPTPYMWSCSIPDMEANISDHHVSDRVNTCSPQEPFFPGKPQSCRWHMRASKLISLTNPNLIRLTQMFKFHIPLARTSSCLKRLRWVDRHYRIPLLLQQYDMIMLWYQFDAV